MKRIVMLLVFVLVVPAVGFTETPYIYLSTEELQKKTIKELKELKDAANTALENAAKKTPIDKKLLDNISKQIGLIKDALRERESYDRGYDAAKDEEKENNIFKEWGGGFHFGYLFGGNVNQKQWLRGLQLETPPLLRQKTYFEPNWLHNLPSALSARVFFTLSGDMWFMSEGQTQIETDIGITTIGGQLIFRQYFNNARTSWFTLIFGATYNWISQDNQKINTNASKAFDGNEVGFQVGSGFGKRFEKFLLWDTPCIAFIEYHYTFLEVGATEKGTIWENSVTKKINEYHDSGRLFFGISWIIGSL